MLDLAELPLATFDAPKGRYGAVTPSGNAAADAGQVLGGVLGGVASQTAVEVLRHPYVQQKLAEVQQQCQDRAKTGVLEVLKENWHWIIIGVATISFVNYGMLVFGVIPLVRPRTARPAARVA